MFDLTYILKLNGNLTLMNLVVPGKEVKILKAGARGDRGSPDQNESPVPELSNTL